MCGKNKKKDWHIQIQLEYKVYITFNQIQPANELFWSRHWFFPLLALNIHFCLEGPDIHFCTKLNATKVYSCVFTTSKERAVYPVFALLFTPTYFTLQNGVETE